MATAQTLALPPASDTTFSAGALASYSEGRFGGGGTTRILYVPTIFRAYPTERLQLELTVPYVWERGRHIVAFVGGAPNQPLHPVRAGLRTDRVRSEAGIGDVLLDGEYTLLERHGLRPEIGAFVEIKFPTADDTRGLGTGKFDETLGLTLEQKIVERWIASLDVYYIFVGSPRGTSLSDAAGWSLGLSYRPRPALAISAYFDGTTDIHSRQDNPLDLRVQAEYALTKTIKAVGSVTKGLSTGAPDWGTAVGIVFEF